MLSSKPILAAICEAHSRGETATAIQPTEHEDLDLFYFQDPFGLRKAIVAVMQVGNSVPENVSGTLAVRFSGVGPRVGDLVVTIGFPDLDCQPIDDEGIRYLLSDGMSAAYGRIIALHPNGVRNQATPVIE